MRGGGAVYSGARPDEVAAAEANRGSEPSRVAFQGTGYTLNSGPEGRHGTNTSPLTGQGARHSAQAATSSPAASREEQRARALAAAERRMR
jgi:hypothetical protein